MTDMRWLKCTFGMLALQQLAQASVIGIPLSRLGQECFGKSCHTINEYCSPIVEGCMPCSDLCGDGTQAQADKADMCAKECPEFSDFQRVTNQLELIEFQQMVLLVLMILLLLFIGTHYSWKCFRWCRQKRCIIQMLHKLKSKRDPSIMTNGKDLGGTTIQNMGAIHENDRTATSQIYSVTGAEGSVMTMTTPISIRHPAESTTPATASSTEYSYENQALEVTPVSDKPNGSAVF